MKNAAHTPGPWSVEPLLWDDGASIAIVARGQIVATIAPENEEDEPNMHSAKRGPHDEANARLIAVTPELLEAGKAILEWWDVTPCRPAGDEPQGIKDLRSAIANATGAA